jgi:NAD(P)-dependent dehydrogenase (short-subunit alcohol dehydrogenase family)
MVALSYVKDRDRRRRGERDGRATALAFAAAGARVAGADVEEPGAKAVAAEIDAGGGQALPVALDVADRDRAARVLEMDEAAWDRVIRVNLTGAFLMAKAALPAMIARGGGSIVMVASQPGRVASPGGQPTARPRARCSASQGLAADHAAQGIRANTISPAAIETRRMLRRWKDASSFMTGCDLLIDGGYTAV